MAVRPRSLDRRPVPVRALAQVPDLLRAPAQARAPLQTPAPAHGQGAMATAMTRAAEATITAAASKLASR